MIVDGNIITAENYDSAYAFGRIVAAEIIAKAHDNAAPATQDSATDQAILELVG